MKKRIRYTDEPMGPLRIVENFLPPPDQLVLREEGIKVTLSLSRESVDFFKQQAARSKVPYQRMIRSLLDRYAAQHLKSAPKRRRTTARR